MERLDLREQPFGRQDVIPYQRLAEPFTSQAVFERHEAQERLGVVRRRAHAREPVRKLQRRALYGLAGG
jgi:hypothetical protein